jgi:hypothetical protein
LGGDFDGDAYLFKIFHWGAKVKNIDIQTHVILTCHGDYAVPGALRSCEICRSREDIPCVLNDVPICIDADTVNLRLVWMAVHNKSAISNNIAF